jgi:formylglycine-generating enzyme
MRLLIILFFCCGCFMTAFGQQICFEGQLNKGDEFQQNCNIEKAILNWQSGLDFCELTDSQRETLKNRIKNAKKCGTPVPDDNMVFVKGGTFTMGDVLNDNEETDEKPTHSVTLSDFYIGKYEVSQAEWIAVMDTNPSYFKGNNLPVEQVSWDDVKVYLQKLNAKTGKNYRLPTEAEWEYAAREGGKNVRFGNGKNTIDPSEINFDASASYKKPYSVVGEYRVKTVAVNSFAPNALGIYNMSGNVWEWCSDWRGAYSSGSQQNPTGPTTGSNRVFRGGSWLSYPQNCRATIRYSSTPAGRHYDLGFRVVRSPQ